MTPITKKDSDNVSLLMSTPTINGLTMLSIPSPQSTQQSTLPTPTLPTLPTPEQILEQKEQQEQQEKRQLSHAIHRRYYHLQRSILSAGEIRDLHWNNAAFNYPGLVRIGSIGDGSCLFHSIAGSYFKPHQTGKLGDLGFDRKKFIRQFRKDLSIKLGSVDPENSEGKTYYDQLSRGELAEMSKAVPQLSLENMKMILDSDLPVDNTFNEFISNQLDRDIYLLEMTKRDVYMQGDVETFYKGRKSIILLYLPGHYELIGLRTRKGIATLFKPTHPLIRAIYDRIGEKIAIGSSQM